jgi:hypothetical protein
MAITRIRYDRKYQSVVGDEKPDLSVRHLSGVSATLEELQEDDSIKTFIYTEEGWIETPLGGYVGTLTFPAVSASTLISPTGGSLVVTVPGTAVPLVEVITKRSRLYVRAKAGNVGNVYFGDSAVDKTTNQQIVLTPNQSIDISAPLGSCIDIGEFFIDAAEEDEGIDFLFI